MHYSVWAELQHESVDKSILSFRNRLERSINATMDSQL